jgi:hypothetical protein
MSRVKLCACLGGYLRMLDQRGFVEKKILCRLIAKIRAKFLILAHVRAILDLRKRFKSLKSALDSKPSYDPPRRRNSNLKFIHRARLKQVMKCASFLFNNS